MGKRIIALLNVIGIQYLLTSQYQVPHKWEWLVFTGVVLGVVLVVWEKRSRDGGPRPRE